MGFFFTTVVFTGFTTGLTGGLYPGLIDGLSVGGLTTGFVGTLFGMNPGATFCDFGLGRFAPGIVWNAPGLGLPEGGFTPLGMYGGSDAVVGLKGFLPVAITAPFWLRFSRKKGLTPLSLLGAGETREAQDLRRQCADQAPDIFGGF